MILLSVRGVSRQFDVEPVFKNVGFEVRPGEKIGLVGPNGTGKTTLLNILAGLDEPDTGDVERHPSAEIALLEQEPEFPPGRTLLDEAKSGLASLYRLQAESHEIAARMAAAAADPAELDRLHRRFDQIQHDLQRLDAYNVDHRVDEVLAGLGFAREDYGRSLHTFSGGQQNRAVLARMLLRAPDLMLLDEPTNHLDIAATEWLEGWLAQSAQAMLLVSHDRYFLDRVTQRTLEMNGGAVTGYKGNFSAYWSQRAERRKVLERTWEKQQEFIARTEDFIRRNKYGQKHAQASDREKKLARLERVELPPEIARLPMTFGSPARTGDWVFEAAEVAKGFGQPLFRDVTLRVMRGDRIGILGPNGSGKTTLLRTLIGELPPDSGSVRFGTGVKVAYYDQQLSGVDPEMEAVEAIRPAGDLTLATGELRKVLARFGIRGDQAFQTVGTMSGGEKSKVALARLAMLEANVLVLDEPTNHLDLWARDSLEEALRRFDGTLLFVSHDRYFLDRVATSIIVLTGGAADGAAGWKSYGGNYSDYVEFVKRQAAELQSAPADTAAERASMDGAAAGAGQAASSGRGASREKPARRKRRFPYRPVDQLEAEIAEHEGLVESLQADLADPDLHRDGDRVKDTLRRFEETKSRLEQLYEHWEEAVERN